MHCIVKVFGTVAYLQQTVYFGLICLPYGIGVFLMQLIHFAHIYVCFYAPQLLMVAVFLYLLNSSVSSTFFVV